MYRDTIFWLNWKTKYWERKIAWRVFAFLTWIPLHLTMLPLFLQNYFMSARHTNTLPRADRDEQWCREENFQQLLELGSWQARLDEKSAKGRPAFLLLANIMVSCLNMIWFSEIATKSAISGISCWNATFCFFHYVLTDVHHSCLWCSVWSSHCNRFYSFIIWPTIVAIRNLPQNAFSQ